MEVVLLGTGSADGWPNPFCTCASCGDARQHGEIRGQTGALIDGSLLIDCGPEIPRAAAHLGHRLDDVTTMVFTHAHPDHVGPAALLFRHWARESRPLQVIGPPAVIALCEPWIAPGDPVTLTPIEAGQSIQAGAMNIRALAANHHGPDIGPSVILDVTAGDNTRLLYACDTGVLPTTSVDQLADRRFDIALIEETFGLLEDHDGHHLDLRTFGETLEALQTCHALTRDSQVIAVHLSHHNPPTPQLRQRLRKWGADVVPDGTVLRTAASTAPTPHPGRTLVLGGARSGKSSYAEQLVATASDVTYLATADAQMDDEEWQQRIARHRAQRPDHWTTQETIDVATVLTAAGETDVLLIDCLTLWLTRVIDETGGWDGDLSTVEKRIDELVESLRHCQARVVMVSNEVGWGVVPASSSGRLFRDLQGRLNAAVAAVSDHVTLMVAGRPVQIGNVQEQLS